MFVIRHFLQNQRYATSGIRLFWILRECLNIKLVKIYYNKLHGSAKQHNVWLSVGLHSDEILLIVKALHTSLEVRSLFNDIYINLRAETDEEYQISLIYPMSEKDWRSQIACTKIKNDIENLRGRRHGLGMQANWTQASSTTFLTHVLFLDH